MAGTAAAIPSRVEYALGSCGKRFKKNCGRVIKLLAGLGSHVLILRGRSTASPWDSGKSEFPELEGMDYDDFEEDQAQSAEEV